MVFDGPALADGSMNVRDLAPAMMAVGSFFEAANRITNGERTSVSVNVRATSAGSFQVFLRSSRTSKPWTYFALTLATSLPRRTH